MTRSIIAIVLATLAFSIWGYIWYATVFDDNLAIARGHIQSVFVILISLVQVLAIFALLRWVKAKRFIEYMGVSLLLSTLIVLPSIGNSTLFAGTPVGLLMLDYGHFLFGYAGIALVFFIIDHLIKKPRKYSEA